MRASLNMLLPKQQARLSVWGRACAEIEAGEKVRAGPCMRHRSSHQAAQVHAVTVLSCKADSNRSNTLATQWARSCRYSSHLHSPQWRLCRSRCLSLLEGAAAGARQRVGG